MGPPNQRYSFKNLDFWQAAQQSAIDVECVVDGLPNRHSADIVASQTLRAATSNPANIAEGLGGFSFAAYKNHPSTKGAVNETESWLDYLVQLGSIEEERGKEMEGKCARLIRALTRGMQALEQQERKRQLRVYEAGNDVVPWFPGSKVPDVEEGEVER